MEEHILITLARRYPQLLFQIDYGTRGSQEYRDAVLRGRKVDRLPQFTFSPNDLFETVETPAGEVEILYLSERADFVHGLQALAYRCEPREVPPSIGANTIRGLTNWEKIRRHKADYLRSGKLDWGEEFKRFTSNKENYCDTLILLSQGDYSSVPAEAAGCAPDEWMKISFEIRKYHELTHFVCRSLFPEKKDAVRDEVIADLIGLVAAVGRYDPHLARLFLGIEGSQYRQGGRLENYVTPEDLAAACVKAETLIDQLSEKLSSARNIGLFETLLTIY